MGAAGVKLLSEVLKANTTLTFLNLDRTHDHDNDIVIERISNILLIYC